jgi:uncharacterized protein YdaU (DUF1376 family)
MKDPAFLFYPNDYIGGTLGMTFEQKGAYIELLMTQFNRGHMTSHMIGQVLGQNSGQIWEVIQSKFKVDGNGLFYNERLEIEQNKRKAFTDSRKNNILGSNQYSKKDKSKTKKQGHTDGHMTSHMENRNRNENINIDFIFFWDLYDKKIGLKDKIEKKWSSLTDDERQLAIEYIHKYKKAQPDKQYRKNPETFLNNKSWNDEIIVKNGTNKEFITGSDRTQQAARGAIESVIERLSQIK